MNGTQSPVRLDQYDNSWFKPGRSLFTQLAWYFIGSPVVQSHWMPTSSFRTAILRLFGARIAEGVVAKPGLRVKFPWKLQVGAHTWIGEDVWIDNLAPVNIGSNCCVSQGAYFCTGNHDWSDPAFGLMVRGIELKDGSWAGAQSLLAPGVVLDECAVAAAGSVVFQSIPSYEIHGGNPAVFLKRRVIRSMSVFNSFEALPASRQQKDTNTLEEAGSTR